MAFQHSTVRPRRGSNLLAGVSSVFNRVGIGVRDADYDLELGNDGIAHISAEQGSSPTAPVAADGGLFYVKSDGKPYYISNTVAETELTASGAAGDSFKTIVVSGQSDIVADASADTLTVVAGSNVTLTTDAATDTLTIAATDSGTTYTAGDGLDLTSTTFSTDLKDAGGLVIEATELAMDLGAVSITGILGVGDGGTGQTTYANGQLLIGNTTGNTLAKATLTAGTGISITNGSGSVTIANTVTDTFRTVTAGGNTLSTSETLAFTAGTGITIAESAGAVTITNTVSDTNTWRTVTAGGNTLSVSETLAFTAGAGVVITESAGAVTISSNLEGTELVSTGETGGSKFLREDGDGTCSWQAAGGGSGDITSVVAGAGMTGGATSGDATLNVIGGDGITANADEVEVTVDGSTIELSASDGSGTIRVKDNGVTLAKMAGLTRGKIIYGDASGDPAALALGDADQVLTHDGTDVSWEDPAGGGGGVSLSGTTNNTVATVTGSNALIGETNLTFDGNSLAITSGSASTIACTITAAGSQTADLLVVENSSNVDLLKVMFDGDLELGFAGTGIIRRANAAGTNVAGGGVHLRGGKSTGNALGGEVRFYTAPAGSSGSSVNNHEQAVVIDGNKIVDFKKTAFEDTMVVLMQATGVSGGRLYLEIKVAGTPYYIPLYQ